jgi:replicative DNA helicase
MKHRGKFDRLITGLPTGALEETTTILLQDFRAYFREFPDVQTIDRKQFMLWFTNFKHKNFNADRTALFEAVVKRVEADVPKEIEQGLMERLITSEAAVVLLGLLERYENGDDIDLIEASRNALETFELSMDRTVRTPFVEDSIESILEEDAVDGGFHWRLDCLNRSMRPLRGGDFGIVAARPDKGKTTFLTSELAFMVKQIVGIYGEVRPIIWFNNEGPGKRIKQRYYQSLLGCTIPEMVEYLKDKTLTTKLLEATGGHNPDDLLKIMDVHEARSHEIELVVRNHPPALVVLDMVDNIKFSGEISNMGSRTDQVLEEMYKWARNMAVRADIPVIATSQVSADGDGEMYPTLPQLKDSKTGKQGACDWIVTLGCLNDPAMDRYRYIGMTKNKLHRAGNSKSPREQVIFDAERARYENPED